MSPKNLMRYAFGLVLAVGLLWWVLRDVDRAALADQLSRVSVAWLALSIVLTLGQNVFRTWRWRALLHPVRPDLPFRPMFAAIVVGYMTSWIIPGRLGEVVRPLALAGRERLPLGPCFGTVVADRLLDACAVVVLFALGAWITPLEGAALANADAIRGAAVFAAFLVLVFLGVMSALTLRERSIQNWLAARGPAVRWVGGVSLALSQGVRALHEPRLLARILLQTTLAWAAIAVGTWAGVRAAGVDVPLGAILFIMPLLVLGIAVPTPGGTGSYHAAMNFGLTLFGISWNAAAGAGLIVHAAMVLPLIALGLILLGTEGISLRHLVEGARQFRGLGGPPGPSGPAPAQRVMESVP